MMKIMTVALIAFLAMLQTCLAQYPGWKHSGSLYILTTPEGANVPATATVENFPLLVRLNKGWFDFSQAKANGEDIRFAGADNKPLAYQIDTWDAAAGTAAIWVRIPAIKGNARQAIKMPWGKADAASESNGKAVFNAANGYLTVFHMSDPVADATGKLMATDTGTTATPGMIGTARRFPGGKGFNCGEKIEGFPTGSAPHSSEAWIKSDVVNGSFLCWGNEKGQGKIIMKIGAPPRMNVECYFSGADIRTEEGKLPMGQWMHVLHTYQQGDSCLYVNGQLLGRSTSKNAPLNLQSPARLYLGGWYNNFKYIGDLDEVRVSNVTRSADWAKLQYENQKPLQTLVGTLVKDGSDFSISANTNQVWNMEEATTYTLNAKADGAIKVYWNLVEKGVSTTLATDTLAFDFFTGRYDVTRNAVLQFKAVYPTAVKTLDLPVKLVNSVQDPEFYLHGHNGWDGRSPFDTVAMFENKEALDKQLTAKKCEPVHVSWKVTGIAATYETQGEKIILKHAQGSGRLTFTATIDNGGSKMIQQKSIVVNAPGQDAWVQRVPGKDEKPEENQFYARDDKNEGTLYYNGTLSNAADSVFLKLYADDKLVCTESQNFTRSGAGVTAPSSVVGGRSGAGVTAPSSVGGATGKALSSVVGGQGYTPAVWSYAFSLKLKAGLIKYKVEFGTKSGSVETVVNTVGNLVCGDAYIVEGQSNAVATDWGSIPPPVYSNTWLRSFGSASKTPLTCKTRWGNADYRPREGILQIGYWPMELGIRLVESEKIPICIINGAVGGTRIDQHVRNDKNPIDDTTIYGRLLWRVREAKLTHGIRGIFWHQGESDQGSDGPTGGYGYDTYRDLFVAMAGNWKNDFPNIRHYYLFQIWPRSCAMGRDGSDDKLREVMRQLPTEFSNMSIMSTLGIIPPGPAHFPPAGYVEIAKAILPLVQEGNYGKKPTTSITPPNIISATYTSEKRDAIALLFDQPLVWNSEAVNELYLDGQRGKVASGTCEGNTLTLKLTESSTAKTIKYVDGGSWRQERILRGQNGIAALTFCDMPIFYGLKDDPTRILRKPIPEKVVALTFDDGCASHATFVGPLLKKLGFKGSFFISEFADVTNKQGTVVGGFGNKNMYMTWEQIKSLHELGMDVGGHGYRHVWADLSANAWMDECVPIEDRCVAAGIPKPVTFCWPVYQVSHRAFPILIKHGYTFCRGGGASAYNPLKHNPFNVPSISISDNDIKKNNDIFINAVKKAVPGEILVLTYHGVPDVEHPGVGTTPSVFEEQMKFLKDNNYKVISLRDMDEYVDPVRAIELRSK